VKKAPKGPPPLSKFKHHPYMDFSVWQGSFYKDQNAAKVVALASGVPLARIKESFGNGKEDDDLANLIEGAIVDRYGSPWSDNPSKARARRVVRR
jgi:hypothetical protein